MLKLVVVLASTARASAFTSLPEEESIELRSIAGTRYGKVKDQAFCGNRICAGASYKAPSKPALL